MKIRKIVSLALVFTMLAQAPILAEEVPEAAISQSGEKSWKETQLEQLELMDLTEMDVQQKEAFSEAGIQPYSTVPDNYESNDTPETAYPYGQVKTLQTKLTNRTQLYNLGMKSAGLHSGTDEDWYTVSITAGQTYFVDLRNIGKKNWYIELYNLEKGYYYTTNPNKKPEFLDVGEKAFYFNAQDSGTFYIRVCSNGEWTGDEMYYFFYVGPAIQTFQIENFPTYGQTGGLYGSNNTYSFNMSGEVPSQTAIIDMYLGDSFSHGNACPDLDKYMSAGGREYHNIKIGENEIGGIYGVPLGQIWTFGATCTKGGHSATHWSASLYGSFQCVMEPYKS